MKNIFNKIMQDKQNKLYFIIVIILIIVSIVIIILPKYTKEKAIYSGITYVILDDNYAIKWNNGIYKLVSSKLLTNKNFSILKDNKYYGTYKYQNFDSNNNVINFLLDNKVYNFNYPYLALGEHVNYIVYDSNELTNQDIRNLKSDYHKSNITNNDDLTYSDKVGLDFDNDTKEETLYLALLDNTSTSESGDVIDSGNSFSLVYYLDDDINTTLINSEVTNEDDEIYFSKYYLMAIVDFNYDDKYEIIIREAINDIPSYKLYALDDNNKYQLVLDEIGN